MNLKTALALSGCLNVALAAALVLQSKSNDAAGPSADAPLIVTNTQTRVVESSAPLTKPAQALDWRAVESEDYRKYIANLRSIGCPEETIKDIIIADVNKLFDERKKALRKPEKEFKFWQTGMQMFGAMMDEETIAQQQALAKEKRELLKALLGIEVDEQPEAAMAAMINPLEQMLGFLSPAKQTQVMELLQQFQAKAMKSVGGGAPDAEDFKAMQQAQKDMEAELARVLTPQELEDYQLRMSQTAMVMRMQMDGFDPNEQEFRQIFKLQKAFDDEFGLMGMGMASKEDREKRDAAQKQLNEKLKGVLGEQRYTDYEREKDFQFKTISKVAQRQGLPKTDAIKVWDMKKIAEDQAKQIRANTALTPDQRQEALRGIRSETERSMQQVLGEQGYKSYQDGRGASWLRGISPDPKQN